jgi:hypothetical protein
MAGAQARFAGHSEVAALAAAARSSRQNALSPNPVSVLSSKLQ